MSDKNFAQHAPDDDVDDKPSDYTNDFESDSTPTDSKSN